MFSFSTLVSFRINEDSILSPQMLCERMPNGNPLSILSTFNVHCLVFPPFPLMNLKHMDVKGERLFKSHHLGQSLYLANEKKSFIVKN
jgi:hypothetical protein